MRKAIVATRGKMQRRWVWLASLILCVVLAAIAILARPSRDPNAARISIERQDPAQSARREWLPKEYESTTADLLIVGDSIAEMWPSDALLPYTVVNLGIGGERTENVLWRVEHYPLPVAPPRIAVISVGTNNLPVDSPTEIAKGIEKVAQVVRERLGIRRIIILSILPRGNKFDEFRQERMLVNSLVTAWARSSNIDMLNVDKRLSCDMNPQGCPNYLKDHIHPSAKGFVILTNELFNIIKSR